MNTFCKAMLLSTVVIGVSSTVAEARHRWVNYNYKAWAQVDAHRETPHVGNPENFYRTARSGQTSSGPITVQRETRQSEPTAVAQAPTERRSFSYDEQQASGEARTAQTTENAQSPDESNRGLMQPSEPSRTSVFNGNSYSSGPNNPPRYILPKTDPRKYRTK